MTRVGGQSQEGGDQLKEAPLRVCHPQELVQERGWVGGGEAGAGPHGGVCLHSHAVRDLSLSAPLGRSGAVPPSPGGWVGGPGRPLAADYAGGAYEGDQGGGSGRAGVRAGRRSGRRSARAWAGELCDRGGYSPGGNVISRLISGGTSQAREAA